MLLTTEPSLQPPVNVIIIPGSQVPCYIVHCLLPVEFIVVVSNVLPVSIETELPEPL